MANNKKMFFLFVFALAFVQGLFASEPISREDQKSKDTNEKSFEIKDSNKYLAIGLGLPGFPSLQFGYRSQHDHKGIDASLQVGSLLSATVNLKGGLSYLYFPKPDLKKEHYFGVGIAYLVSTNLYCFGSGRKVIHILSPEFTWGVQYLKKIGGSRFFQFQIDWPNLGTEHRDFFLSFFPFFAFQYGWMF